MNRPSLLALIVLAVATIPARSADPWHLAGWQARAVVEIPTPSTEPGVDTAGVKVLCQGRAKPDGSMWACEYSERFLGACAMSLLAVQPGRRSADCGLALCLGCTTLFG